MKPLALVLAAWLLAASALSQAADLVPGYWEQTPLPQTGLATFYAPGMMEYVEGYRRDRGQLPDCPECVGTVALLRAGDIGRKVWLEPPGGERIGPFLVIDCARTDDIPPLVDRNWAVDVSYEVGQFWGMDRPLDGVTVLADPADEAAPIAPSLRPTPFSVPPDQVVVTQPTPTPAVTAVLALPTPWPTRQPAPLPGVQPPETVVPQGGFALETPTPAGPPPPTPLTPIVTTPTPSVRVTVAPPLPAATPLPQPAEIAVGRAGVGLLPGVPTVAAPPRPARLSPTPTVRAVVTPVATSEPILPSGSMPTPTPAPTPEDDSPLLHFWRTLLELIGY
ncbi:MAG: hypothetical protein NT169_25655 [Chloroflexi bacterium]|nr:hypothetical protein [Chloroflexota bacterium]